MSSRTQLNYLLSDLRTVKPSLVARRADLQAERFQRVTHSYAVDTNILYFIGQPISQILSQDKLDPSCNYLYQDRRKQVPHVGSLFRTDDRNHHLAIGAALAQFIGFTLSGTSPLLLPDALWPEAQTLLAHFSSFDDPHILKVADQLFRELEKRTIEKIEHKLRKANLTPVDLADLLQKMVHQKIGRQGGLQRLNNLFKDGAIEKLSARPILGVNPLRSLGAHARKLAEVQDELARRTLQIFDKWYQQLGSVGKQDPHLKLDAEALTQVEMRNHLADEQGSLERTLYITLDSAVILAAENVRVDYLDSTFADAFVRHPAAFLNDIGIGVSRTAAVERKTEGEAVSILDWIDVMVSKSSLYSEVPGDERASEEQAEEMVSGIRDEWHHLSELQEDQLFIQFGIAQIEHSLHEKLSSEDIKTALDKLRDEIIDEEAKAWENCFRVAIQLGLNVREQDHQPATRSSPPICFEWWPQAGEAIEQFKIWGAHGLTSRNEFEEIRKQLEGGEDRSGYSYFLACAAFFAARGDWGAAAGVASFAREMAYRIGFIDRRGANGREATYLEAVARQHLVRHSDELARAVELIEECKNILEEEMAEATRPLEIAPERFDLELLDIEHVRCLFRWAAEEDINVVRSDMTELLGRYRGLQLQLQKQVDRLTVDRTPIVLGGLAYVLVQTEIRTIVSAFLLISVGEINLDEAVQRPVSEMLARLTVLSEISSKRRSGPTLVQTQDSSALAKVAIAAVRSLLAKAAGRQPNPRLNREAKMAFHQKNLRSHHTFPFDSRRFRAMQQALSAFPAK
jgi:hypothetical protein